MPNRSGEGTKPGDDRSRPPSGSCQVFRYTRDEMMELRASPLSQARPEHLLKEFNNDNGLFSPDKWLEYRWQCEGIENRPKRKVENLKIEEGESTGLSPQRRGFSSGCRAPPEEKTNDDEDRSNARNWRNAQFKTQNGGNDFRPSFQKQENGNATRGRPASSTWRTSNADFRPNFGQQGGRYARNSTRGRESEERVPEWADTPSTMDDLVELKGFDDNREKKPKKNSAKEPPKPKEKKVEGSGSRPNSRGNVEASRDTTPPSSAPTQLPSSDAEFAHLLGIDLGAKDDSAVATDFIQPKEAKSVPIEEKPPSGSRLSRFFKKNSETDMAISQKDKPRIAAGGDVASQPPQLPASSEKSILQRIFATSSPTHGSSSPPTGPPEGNVRSGMLRLEDLERSLRQDVEERRHATYPQEMERGNPLTDPGEQARLLSRLTDISQQRSEGDSPSVSSSSSQQQFPVNPAAAAQITAVALSMGMPPHIVHQMNPQDLQALIMHHQQQRMLAAAMNNVNGPAAVQQYQAMVRAAQLHAASVARNSATAFIPSSVQRRTGVEEKPKVASSDERPPADDPVASAQRDLMMKKLMVQQHYSNVMNAMQAGIPLGAFRPPQLQQQLLYAQQMAQQQSQNPDFLREQQRLQMERLRSSDGAPLGSPSTSRAHPPASHGMDEQLQSPLEKLLSAAGAQPVSSQIPGSHSPNLYRPLPHNAHSLEEIERRFTEGNK